MIDNKNGEGYTLRIAFGITVLAFLMIAGSAEAANTNQDFNYSANPPRAQVSPDTIIPTAVPLCNTSHTTAPTYPVLYCYSPNFIQTSYNFTGLYAEGFNGTGQTIVIVDAYGSPTIRQDLEHFDSVFGLPSAKLDIICPAGCPTFNPRNTFHDEIGWTIETTLDVEWAHAVAQGAHIVLAVAPSSGGNAINTVERYVIQNYPGAIMSQSFGIPEAVINGNNVQVIQAHANYQNAVAQGITVLASSGDSGATNGFSFPNALFPSSDPFVTSIGGTQGMPLGNLATYAGTCARGPRPGYPSGCTPTGYGAEQVWNEAWIGAAGGGAPSLIFTSPPYQGGTGMRTTPDISYNAAVDGGVLVYYSALGTPTWFVVGGTSAGSPQWAGIFAIANQVRADNGKGSLGFVNPALYTIGNNPAQYAADFHDITAGNNTLVGTPIGYNAVTGYDKATGWGTPDVGNLVQDLNT